MHAVLLLALGLSTSAAVEPGSPPRSDRSGLYLRVGGGIGYTSGSYSFSGLSEPGFPPVRELHFEVDLAGPLVQVHTAGGWGIVRGLALALELGAALMPTFERHGRLGESNIDGALLLHGGPLVDAHPWLDLPLHLQLGIALARASFISSTNDIGSAENIVDVVPVSGWLLHAGVGYEVVSSLAVTLRASYGRLSGGPSDYAPAFAALEASYLVF